MIYQPDMCNKFSGLSHRTKMVTSLVRHGPFSKEKLLQAEIQYRGIAIELGQYREIMYERYITPMTYG